MSLIALRQLSAGIVALSIAMGFANPASHASDAPDLSRKLEEYVRAFDETAMRVNGSRAKELARWTGTIYLAFADTSGVERVSGEIETLVRTLATVARVDVQRVSVDDPRRNFYVRASTREANGSFPCLSSVQWDDWGRMAKVEVHLNLSNFARLSRCFNHEVLHGFGLRSHPETAFSVLSYRHAQQAHMTETDEIVLATLYDPRVPATGSMTTAARIACGIIAEKLNMSPQAAEPVCAGRSAPARRGLFAALGRSRGDIQENISQ